MVLQSAKKRFPHETHSHAWIVSEQILSFTKAMHHEKWQIAEAAVTQLKAVDNWESKLRYVAAMLKYIIYPNYL